MAKPRYDETEDGFPAGIAKPALRALHGAGYTRLEQLATVTEAELGKLHGMGPKALGQLRDALHAKGLAFAPSREAEESRSRGVEESRSRRPRAVGR